MTKPRLNQLCFASWGATRVLSVIGIAVFLLGLSGIASAGTVYVPLPTGNPVTDWHNVQSAVDSADDGDTVQFGTGTYVLGDESEFIVVSTPEVTLVGSPEGTTILGGEVPRVPSTEPCEPYLYGDCSLLQSPPRGFYLMGAEQIFSGIKLKGFRTSLLIGFGEFASTGGYVVENCEFLDTLYGIQAYVESEEETIIRGNRFINTMYGYHISGGKYRVSYNYSSTPEPERVPVDGYTHATGSLNAGAKFFDEGQALISNHNIFEHNIVSGGIEDGLQLWASTGGLISNNLILSNEFYDMGSDPNKGRGTFALLLSVGGNIINNAFVDNILHGSIEDGFATLNFGGAIDGNVFVGNELTSIAKSWDGVLMYRTSNTILLDNVIAGVKSDDLFHGAFFFQGSSNYLLLNDIDAEIAGGFYYSPDGLFASDDPADVAVDQDGNSVQSLDPNQDFRRLLRCERHLKDTESVGDFRECVDEALEKLH